jgi:1,4-alpha-glucan branching enzyme
MLYAYNENFVLPFSHDEVVHGKRSMLGKMPGDWWQKHANLRALLAYMYAHPGKKLLFMGSEFAQSREWNHDVSLDWHLMDYPSHRGMHRLVSDLNALLTNEPALYERDHTAGSFSWIDCNDHENSVISFIRRGATEADILVVVVNFTPVVRQGYRIGVPEAGTYREVVNTDAEIYGGGNVGNGGAVESEPVARHGHGQSLHLTLPPLACLVLKPARPQALEE